MPKRKILMIAPVPPTRSGIAVYSWKLYKALKGKSSITLLTKGDRKGLAENNIIRSRNSLDLVKKTINLMKEPRIKVFYQLGLRSLGGHIFTIIYTIIILALRKILGKCLAITLHTIPTLAAIKNSIKTLKILSYIAFAVYKKLLDLIVENTDVLIVHSLYMKKYLVKHHNAQGEKILVIPHGAENYECKDSGGHKEQFRILLHGFLRRSKGITVLLESVKILKSKGYPIKLSIIGPTHTGEKTDWLIKEIEKRNMRGVVDLHVNFIPDRALEKLVCESDLIVLPYTDKFIEVSGVLAKSISAGKPIVCSKAPKFLIDVEVSKYLTYIQKLDSRELAEKIEHIINNYEQELEKSKNLRKIAEGRNWSKVAGELLREIEKRC